MAGNQHRILIIDDDPDILDILKTAFEHSREVVLASDGMDGLAKLQASEPDLVILDMQMPKFDGNGVLEAIRHSKVNKKTKVIFITAFGSEASEMEYLEKGADCFFPKPFNVIELKHQVDEMLKEIPPRPKTLSARDLEIMQ
jgi:DNA-binding response OmpR family regulator